MIDPDTADRAEAVFYSAFENGDIESMEAVWALSDEAVCVHPHGPQLQGYEQIMESWRDILGNTSGFRISVEVLSQYDTPQMSIRFVTETLFNETGRSDPVTVLATNAYRKTESGWRIVLHHASPVHPTSEDVDDGSDEWNTDVTLH